MCRTVPSRLCSRHPTLLCRRRALRALDLGLGGGCGNRRLPPTQREREGHVVKRPPALRVVGPPSAPSPPARRALELTRVVWVGVRQQRKLRASMRALLPTWAPLPMRAPVLWCRVRPSRGLGGARGGSPATQPEATNFRQVSNRPASARATLRSSAGGARCARLILAWGGDAAIAASRQRREKEKDTS